jgi:hypothetical protein
MNQVIVVRNFESKNEYFRRELSQGEKPWEVLQQLMQMDFEVEKTLIEFVMDPDREQREQQEKEKAAELAATIGQP